jgi:ribA/ribD-fused uncharacterized protein
MINCFDGKWAFLSNFYWNEIEYDGITYPTNEHFFQAMKTLDIETRKAIAAAPTPGAAKRMGRHVPLRPDWESVKEDVMFLGLCLKFADEQLADWLLETGDEELIEGNWWGDTTWGVCNGVGENKLGRLLMKVRDMIKEERGI